MPLQPGERFGPYEVRGALGAGGMGEVYRALDTSLGREVALKILPPLLAGDPERLARFDREARLLASLNHANIATLYGFERGEGRQILIMELVEGESLAQRLKKGPIPRDEILEIFEQIAEGLESAHESGIIHRDLKPGNIMITPDGRVKLLDFGLAKALEGEGGVTSDASMSPTLTALATARGEVMGTASYMSPEQARGKPVDRRTDIWAYGCVLYECLAGKMAFGGETISDTIALILQREPDLEALPDDLPPRITELLLRCFEKDARKRLRDIGEARLQIAKVRSGDLAPADSSGGLPMASGGVAMAPGARGGRGLSPLAAAVLVAAGIAVGGLAGWVGLRPAAPAGPGAGPVRFVMDPPAGYEMTYPYGTADGSRVIFFGTETAGESRERRTFLFVRSMDSLESRRLDETEGVQTFELSPDSRWICFVVPTSPGASTHVLKKAPLDGSAPALTLADWSLEWSEAMAWPRDDLILVKTQDDRLVKIPTDGSMELEETELKVPGGVRDLTLRSSLPSGGRVLATSASWTGRGYHNEIHVVSHASGEVRRILDDGASPWWSPTGHLVFTRNTTLFGVAVDPATLEPRGAAVPLLEGLGTQAADAGAIFSLSPAGILFHRPGGRWGVSRRVVFIGPAGELTEWSGERLSYQDLAVSPDGSRVAFTIMGDDLLFAVWTAEMDRPRLRLLAKLPEVDCTSPHWMPDNETVLYSCVGNVEEGPGLYRARADGSRRGELIMADDTRTWAGLPAESVSPDGRWLIVRRGNRGIPTTTLHLMDLSAEDPAATSRPLVEGGSPAWVAAFSPDGRAVALLTLTGQGREIHLRRFSPDGSVGPPVIAADGELEELYWHPGPGEGTYDLTYGDRRGRHWRLSVRIDPSLRAGDPHLELDGSKIRPFIEDHDLMPGGRLLGIQRGEDEDTRFGTVVVVNWLEELERLMAAAR